MICSDDCFCATLTYDEVVPYKGNESCPTDEELIFVWYERECVQCLTWWVERVRIDGRYQTVLDKVKSRWPDVNFEDLWQSVAAEIWKKPQEIRNAEGFVYRLLWRAAYRASGIGRKSSWTPIDPLAPEQDLLNIPAREVEKAYPRLAALSECLNLLGKFKRRVVDLIYFEQTNLQDVATTLGMTYDAVAQRIHRIREELKTCIDSKEV